MPMIANGQQDWRTVMAWDPAADEAARWQRWAPRQEIGPTFAVAAEAGDRRAALRIAGSGNAACCGSWRRRVDAVREGAAYRVTVRGRAEQVAQPMQSLFARLEWLDGEGQRLRPPDNATITAGADGAIAMEHYTLAPSGARSVIVEVGLRWSGGGAASYDVVRLEQAPALPARPLRIAGVFHRPRDTASAADSVSRFGALLASEACAGCDLICLPEGITVIGTGRTYADVAEPVPGPTTAALGEMAARRRAYVIAGLYERAGERIYNTAVLLGRDGELVGTYRKTHLPQEEADAGLTPGQSYPVFQTDFGRLGIMDCWDVQFPEPARALARAGAEVIALPIWGGSEVLARARAIENHVYLVTSSYDMPTMVVGPAGDVLAVATAEQPVAAATVDLAAPVLQLPWLGDMKSRTWIERRGDLPKA
jgi:predicted amidohydrolase